MKILLIGSGGREHALAWRFCSSPLCEKLLLAPGSDAMQDLGERLAPLSLEELADVAQQRGVNLCVIGPEAPLAQGLADMLRARGIPTFGPGRQAAQLEASKDFSKRFMLKHGVATAQARSFEAAGPAREYALTRGFPVVAKADGLAAGKGVTVATNHAELEAALRACFEEKTFGQAGSKVLIEDFLEGEEASLLCLCDGKRLIPMQPAQDHKRIFDNDQGSNTGGMGAYSPVPLVDDAALARVDQEILQPTLLGLKAEGLDFRGCLYLGLMMGPQGPKLLEYNVRFGDPETQALVPRMDFDLVAVMLSCANGELNPKELRWKPQACASVVLASGGYPGAFRKGLPIHGLEQAAACEGVTIFHASTQRQARGFVTTGGRVLSVSALGADLRQALARAYSAAASISFEGMHYRRDIGLRALART